jgi:prophage regulatory protein
VNQALLRIDQVMALVGRRRTSLWRMCKLGRFPKPVQLSVRSVAWRASEVEEWLQNLPRAHAYGGASQAGVAMTAKGQHEE